MASAGWGETWSSFPREYTDMAMPVALDHRIRNELLQAVDLDGRRGAVAVVAERGARLLWPFALRAAALVARRSDVRWAAAGAIAAHLEGSEDTGAERMLLTALARGCRLGRLDPADVFSKVARALASDASSPLLAPHVGDTAELEGCGLNEVTTPEGLRFLTTADHDTYFGPWSQRHRLRPPWETTG